MSKSMQPVENPQEATAGTKQFIREGDLDGSSTLRQGEPIPIWSEKANEGKALAFGYGTPDRESGNTEFIYADLRHSDADADGTADKATGELVMQVRDVHNQEVIASEAITDLETLRADASDSKTERTVLPLMDEAAGPHKYLTLCVRAGSFSDGKTLNTGGSNVRLVRSELTVN